MMIGKHWVSATAVTVATAGAVIALPIFLSALVNPVSGQWLSDHPGNAPNPRHQYPCAIPHASEAEIPGTSDRMEGSTAVAVFIPNNTGAKTDEPVAIVWTDELLAKVMD